jgi:hypothetical protein
MTSLLIATKFPLDRITQKVQHFQRNESVAQNQLPKHTMYKQAHTPRYHPVTTLTSDSLVSRTETPTIFSMVYGMTVEEHTERSRQQQSTAQQTAQTTYRRLNNYSCKTLLDWYVRPLDVQNNLKLKCRFAVKSRR